MRGLNLFAARQIRDGARQFEDAVIGTCRQIELTHRRPHQALTFGLEAAKLPDLVDAHVCVAKDIGRLEIGKSVMLNVPCSLHAFADGLARFAEFVPAEFFIIHA